MTEKFKESSNDSKCISKTKVGCACCGFSGYRENCQDFGISVGKIPCKECNPDGKAIYYGNDYRSW